LALKSEGWYFFGFPFCRVPSHTEEKYSLSNHQTREEMPKEAETRRAGSSPANRRVKKRRRHGYPPPPIQETDERREIGPDGGEQSECDERVGTHVQQAKWRFGFQDHCVNWIYW